MSDTPYTDKHSLGFSPLVEDRWMHEDDARKIEQRCNDLEKAMSYSSRSITLLSKFLKAIEERNQAQQSLKVAMNEINMLKTAIQETLEKNSHLADGDDCTLIALKKAVPDWD